MGQWITQKKKEPVKHLPYSNCKTIIRIDHIC
jgi:hypothetical protein